MSVKYAEKSSRYIASLTDIKRTLTEHPRKHTSHATKHNKICIKESSAPAGIRTRVTDSKGRYT